MGDRESGRTMQDRHACLETWAGRRGKKADTPSNTGTRVGKQPGTIGDNEDKNPGRRAHHKGKQQGRWDRGRKIVRKAVAIQHRHPHGETNGKKRPQDLGKAGTPSNTSTHVGRQWETLENNGRQDLRKADAQSTQHRHTCAETMRSNRRPQADTPSNTAIRNNGGQWKAMTTQAHIENGRQGETRADKGDVTKCFACQRKMKVDVAKRHGYHAKSRGAPSEQANPSASPHPPQCL